MRGGDAPTGEVGSTAAPLDGAPHLPHSALGAAITNNPRMRDASWEGGVIALSEKSDRRFIEACRPGSLDVSSLVLSVIPPRVTPNRGRGLIRMAHPLATSLRAGVSCPRSRARAGRQASKQTAVEPGIRPVTLSNWVRQDDIDDGGRPGVPSPESGELRPGVCPMNGVSGPAVIS